MTFKPVSEMNKKLAKEMTTNFTDVDISKLSFTNLEENDRSKGQKIAYPRYDHPQLGIDSPLFIQFPWISLFSYGVPKESEYYKDVFQRLFVKVPLDQSIPEIKIFSNFLKSIDAKLGSSEYKEQLFGAKGNKYEYQPIFRMPQEEEEDDVQKSKNKKKDYGPKHPYMKLKVDASYPDNKILSIVFTSILDNTNKRVRTKINNIETIDDFSSYVSYKSRIHPIARPVKLWAQSLSKKDPSYGLTFKLVKVEVEPSTNNISKVKDYGEVDGFLNSDSESDKEIIQKVRSSSANEKSTSSSANEKQIVSPTLESESDSDNSDSDKLNSDAESDDSAEIKPITKITAKAVPKSKSKSKS